MGETNNFDPKWPHGHVTRDGRTARLIPDVVVRDGGGRERLIAILESDASRHPGEVVQRYFRDGRSSDSPMDTPEDLRNAVAPKARRVIRQRLHVGYSPYNGATWVGVVPEEFRFATLSITGEIEEGATIEVKLP